MILLCLQHTKPLLERNTHAYVKPLKSFPPKRLPFLFQCNTLQDVSRCMRSPSSCSVVRFPDPCTPVALLLCHDAGEPLPPKAPGQNSQLAGPLHLDVITAPQEQSVKIKFTNNPYPTASFFP